MRSVRLGDQLETRLKKAAKESGLPASQIIREGVEERVSLLLGDTVAKAFAPYVGKVRSNGKHSARNHRKELGEILEAKMARRRRKAVG